MSVPAEPLTPAQMRRLNEVVAAAGRACDGSAADAIATLTCAIALFAASTKDPIATIAAAQAGLARSSEAYQRLLAREQGSTTPPRSVPS